VYINNQLKFVLTEEGYIEKAGISWNRYFFLKDRLGNNRIVVHENKSVLQVTNYYPSGVVMAESPAYLNTSIQPYKFAGKELDRTKGLDFYDFEARQFDPTLMRFTSMDLLAEKYPRISPYAYCANNPVNAIDPDGMDWVLRYVDGKAEYYYDRSVTSQEDINKKYHY
jgi:RHS repeat-associated protein